MSRHNRETGRSLRDYRRETAPVGEEATLGSKQVEAVWGGGGERSETRDGAATRQGTDLHTHIHTHFFFGTYIQILTGRNDTNIPPSLHPVESRVYF